MSGELGWLEWEQQRAKLLAVERERDALALALRERSMDYHWQTHWALWSNCRLEPCATDRERTEATGGDG